MKQRTKLDLGEFLPYLVNRAGMIIAEQFGIETLARHQLSIVMWRVMAVLASNGSQSQTNLAELTSIDASTLSRIVTRLVRMGVLTRTRMSDWPRCRRSPVWRNACGSSPWIATGEAAGGLSVGR